jgi:hypothetical protein
MHGPPVPTSAAAKSIGALAGAPVSMTGIAKSFCVVGDGQTSTGPASEPELPASGKPPSPIRFPPLLAPPLLLELETPPDELTLPPELPLLPPGGGVPLPKPEPERFPQAYEKSAATAKARASPYDQRLFIAAVLWTTPPGVGASF